MQEAADQILCCHIYILQCSIYISNSQVYPPMWILIPPHGGHTEANYLFGHTRDAFQVYRKIWNLKKTKHRGWNPPQVKTHSLCMHRKHSCCWWGAADDGKESKWTLKHHHQRVGREVRWGSRASRAGRCCPVVRGGRRVGGEGRVGLKIPPFPPGRQKLFPVLPWPPQSGWQCREGEGAPQVYMQDFF